MLAAFPPEVQNHLAHLTEGIRGQFAFLPSVADFVSMAKEFEKVRSAKEKQKTFVKIYVHTPQWKAWEEYRGRSMPIVDLVDPHGNKARGFYMETEFPPNG